MCDPYFDDERLSVITLRIFFFSDWVFCAWTLIQEMLDVWKWRREEDALKSDWERSELRNETRVGRRRLAPTFNQNGLCWKKKKKQHELDGFDNGYSSRTVATDKQQNISFWVLFCFLGF
jgi:hypothetical protein